MSDPIQTPPSNRCTCWLGTGATFGDSEQRMACSVHGDGAATPSPAWEQEMEWATRRVEILAACFRTNAGRFGEKLLRGQGYPNEVMSEAQDALALDTLLAALAARAADASQIADLQKENTRLRAMLPTERDVCAHHEGSAIVSDSDCVACDLEDTEARVTALSALLQSIGAACGFPVVDNLEQLAGTIVKAIQRRDSEVTALSAQVAEQKAELAAFALAYERKKELEAQAAIPTACGLSQSTLHAAVNQLDQQAIQEDCPHIHIGANPEGVLCRDCRKQWTGERAEAIWQQLPATEALLARVAQLEQEKAEARPVVRLDSYYEWCMEKERRHVAEADGVGGPSSILIALIDSLLNQCDVIVPATGYNALVDTLRAEYQRVCIIKPPAWLQRRQLRQSRAEQGEGSK